jgi:glycosyltransferase involved in cell wall biosynthesis
LRGGPAHFEIFERGEGAAPRWTHLTMESRISPRETRASQALAPSETGSAVVRPAGPLPDGVSVVVPVYNSALSLPELVEKLAVVLPPCAERYELILVDDGRRAASARVIREIVGRNQWVRGIELMRNFGQHNALLAGIRAARYAVVVTMDDDLQNPPEEVPRLVATLAEGFDVVYGTPKRGEHGLWRDLASRVTKLALQSAMGVDVARHASAFRAFRTQLRMAFAGNYSPFVSVDVLLTWGTTRFTAIPVQHLPRRIGTSNYTLRRLITHALNMMTGYSTLPLRIASLLGFAFTLFGIAVLVWVVGRYFIEGGSIPGFPVLASIVAIFAGVQLFALGIFGEYLARMHVRSMGRPSSVVRNSIEPPAETPE